MTRTTKKVPKAKERHDGAGWENRLTGLGVLGRDKRLGATFTSMTLTQEGSEEIYKGDDIAARIVDTIPNEMLREGFEVSIADDPDGAEKFEQQMRKLDVIEQLRKALQMERWAGGGGLLLGVNDGQPLSRPLDEARVKNFDFMTLFTPRELMPLRYYSNPTAARYGEVEAYRLVPFDAPPSAPVISFPEVHESRILRFGGVQTSRGAVLRNVMPGWGNSVLVRCIQTVNDFQASWQGAAILMQDFAPTVLKMIGLAKIMAGQAKNDQTLSQRAQAIALARSIANTTIIDKDEEFERKTVSVGGLAEMLQQQMLRLAATAEMPVSLLMGQAPAGLNATGDSDIRWFYDQISAKQESMLRPRLMKIMRLIMLANGGEPKRWEMKFHPLWQLTETEQADVRLKQAQADQIYLVNKVVTPQEIARSRFTRRGYSTETVIDFSLRDKLKKAEDEAVHLGAGAAEDKAKEQANATAAAKKPAAGPPGAPPGV